MSTNLEQVAGALAEFSKVEAGLATLREQFAGVVYDVTTAEGMEAARLARRTIREPRYEIEKVRKGAKAPLLALGRQIDDEAKRITTALMAIEGPIDMQIVTEEARREAERQAKIEAERKRVEAIRGAIDRFRNMTVLAATASAARIESMLNDLGMVAIDADRFQEFTEEALRVYTATIDALRELHSAAAEREAEQDRLAAAKAELERKQAEQREREKAEREQRDAEAAAERAKLAAEREELAQQRAEIERQKAATAATAATPPELEAPATVATVATPEPRQPRPSEIIDLVASHYGVQRTTAIRWLRGMFGIKDAA